jgi:Cu-Zn family superoxide dismutase
MKKVAVFVSAALLFTAPLAAAESPVQAQANLKPTAGNEAGGTIRFEQTTKGVRVVADMKGLSPGKHGFHVHEKGDCSAPDAKSAGGHFAPGETPHGAPENPPAKRHAGDLGNIEAGKDGKAYYSRVDSVLQLSGPDSIIGKAVVVHAGPDDLSSQPAGNSGARVACGVIELSSK